MGQIHFWQSERPVRHALSLPGPGRAAPAIDNPEEALNEALLALAEQVVGVIQFKFDGASKANKAFVDWNNIYL